MSADWIVAAATVGTFIVIAASAIAALVQLRHMRQSNQIAALNEARETIDPPEFRELMRFIRAELPAPLKDAAVRRSFLGRSWFRDVPENLGLFVKNGIIEGEITCELWSQVVVDVWEAFGPIAMQRRVVIGNPALRKALSSWQY